MPKTEHQQDQLLPGVREIEHTADLGMEVEAASLEELFGRAAAGTMALVRSGDEPDVPEERLGAHAPAASGSAPAASSAEPRMLRIQLDGGTEEDLAGLLVRWLRELLYLQEVQGFVYGQATFERLDESGLRATVWPAADPSPQIRELKGVTYHGLEVERAGDRWRARVIFDI